MLDFFLPRGILLQKFNDRGAINISTFPLPGRHRGERKGAIAEGSHRCLAVDTWDAGEHSADCHFGGELSLLRI